jgi:hypothetical protein
MGIDKDSLAQALGLPTCSICGAVCQWEPGKPVMIPVDDLVEGHRRMAEHIKAIVKGAGRDGIRQGDLVTLLGLPVAECDDPDAVLRDPRAVEAA